MFLIIHFVWPNLLRCSRNTTSTEYRSVVWLEITVFSQLNKQIIDISITFLDLFGIVVAGLKHVKDGESSQYIALSIKRRFRITFIRKFLFFVQLQQKSATPSADKLGPSGTDIDYSLGRIAALARCRLLQQME